MNLINKAEEVMKNAYAIYSKFQVGCVIVTESGKTFAGCNIENASFSATICAERVAIGQAVSAGERTIKEVYLINSTNRPCMPCGVCLQVISEFAKEVDIISASVDKKLVERHKLSELLPFAYDRTFLKL